MNFFQYLLSRENPIQQPEEDPPSFERTRKAAAASASAGPQPMPNDYDYNQAVQYYSNPRVTNPRGFTMAGEPIQNLLPSILEGTSPRVSPVPPEDQQFDESFINYLLNGPDRQGGFR